MNEFIQQLEDVIPWKRIVVPKHLLERWYDEHGDGRTPKEIALTVDKDFDCESDEQIWDLLVSLRDSTKNAKPSNPPFTGKKKTTL